MNLVDWIGAVGVFQILLAYVLNITGNAGNNSKLFLLLNLFGASMACLASILLNYMPFIILEGVWAAVSLVSFLKHSLLKS